MAARFLRYAAPAIVIGAYFYLTRDIWPPILIAFLLAALLHPVIQRLVSRGRSRALAVILVYASSLAILALVLTLLVPAAVKQARSLADSLQQTETSMTAPSTNAAPNRTLRFGKARIPFTTVHLGEGAIRIPTLVAARLPEISAKATVWITDWLKWLAKTMLGMAPNLIWLVLIPILSFYFLLDYERILDRAIALIPASRRHSVLTLGNEIGMVFTRYVRSLAMLCVLDSILTSSILTMMGVKQAVVLGLVAGVLYVVPYIGAILSTFLIGMTALVTGSWTLALWVILVMLLLHHVFLDEIVAPRLLGGHVGLHPILSIVAMLSGEKLFGPAGMIMAVPVAASIQILILRLYPHLAEDISTKHAPPGKDLPTIEADASPGQPADRPPPDRPPADRPPVDRPAPEKPPLEKPSLETTPLEQPQLA